MPIAAKPLTINIHRSLYNLELKCARIKNALPLLPISKNTKETSIRNWTMKNAASYIPVSTRRLYSSAIVWFMKLYNSFQQYNWKLWFSSMGASFNFIWNITWKGCSCGSLCRFCCSRFGEYRICDTAPTGRMLSKPLAYFAMSTFLPCLCRTIVTTSSCFPASCNNFLLLPF